jgi:Holliday junction resolvasome RuvABC endonuclease subunit
MMILALDPGTETGWALYHLGNTRSGSHKMTALPATKKRKAEPEHYRCRNMWSWLAQTCLLYGYPNLIVFESLEGFVAKGKKAAQVNNELRGVIKAFAGVNDIALLAVQPADVKRFATGKGNADKVEMVEAARSKYGYLGDNHNEADAILILQWALKYYTF